MLRIVWQYFKREKKVFVVSDLYLCYWNRCGRYYDYDYDYTSTTLQRFRQAAGLNLRSRPAERFANARVRRLNQHAA